MTKVSIIDVTLGIKVDDIISENVISLTGKARQELDTAIEERKKVTEVKNQRDAKKKAANDRIDQVMKLAYGKLETAGENGVPIDQILEIIKDCVPNTSAFTLRMRKILKDRGNPYRIIRKTRNKQPFYIFEPFNSSG
jgi:hypothetical protein